MKRLIFILPALALLFLLPSCFKEDEKVTPHTPGTAETDTIPMTQDYRYQLYYSLNRDSIVSRNLKTESDLAFECTASGWHVILNTSDFMTAADLGNVAFGLPQDTVGLAWKFDKSDGDLDSTVIGQWWKLEGQDTVGNGHVYAINAGIDEAGNPLGYYQLILDSLKNRTYWFRYATLDGGPVTSASVKCDPDINFRYYSLRNASIEPLEPPKSDWDLLFTQYTTLLYTDLGEPYPYIVTGVQSNRNGVEVAMDTIHDFESITYDIASQLEFSGKLDAIGYEWKYYNFETGRYSVNFGQNYVIRSVEGFYFKLRFIGYYNELDEKGYPVIEFQKL